MPSSPNHPPVTVVLYDGDCSFCRKTVDFARHRDPSTTLRFVPLQSHEGHNLLAQHGLAADQLDSVVTIENAEVSLRSTAILRICRRLSGAWPLLYAGILLPRGLRDGLYAAVARRRR